MKFQSSMFSKEKVFFGLGHMVLTSNIQTKFQTITRANKCLEKNLKVFFAVKLNKLLHTCKKYGVKF